jgi:hypothetical protein
MARETWFWVVFFLWIIYGFASPRIANPQYRQWGDNILLAILIALLGWHDFGAAVK